MKAETTWAYGVYDPDGKLMFPTLDKSYALAMAGAGGMMCEDWPALKELGFECLRINLVPIPRKKPS